IDAPSYQTSVCHGDSGGPLLMTVSSELVQIGITSFGVAENCPTHSPQVDTRVDVVSAWVLGEIAAPPAAGAAPAPARSTIQELPLLRRAAAKRRASRVLRTDEQLGPRFRMHSGYRVLCRRLGKSSVRCRVSWYRAPIEYSGQVTIFLRWEGSKAVWDYHYSV